jgi:hypothetical protein
MVIFFFKKEKKAEEKYMTPSDERTKNEVF